MKFFVNISPTFPQKRKTPTLTLGSFLAYFVLKIVGAEGGTRTHTPLLVTDFKSVASTIPPPRLWDIMFVFHMEATGGFEPPNRGFADLRLSPLGYVA